VQLLLRLSLFQRDFFFFFRQEGLFFGGVDGGGGDLACFPAVLLQPASRPLPGGFFFSRCPGLLATLLLRGSLRLGAVGCPPCGGCLVGLPRGGAPCCVFFFFWVGAPTVWFSLPAFSHSGGPGPLRGAAAGVLWSSSSSSVAGGCSALLLSAPPARRFLSFFFPFLRPFAPSVSRPTEPELG